MTAAARRAAYSVRAADAIGRENLGKPAVATAIEEAIITELKRIAFSDPSQLMSREPDGVARLRASEKLSADVVAAVAEVSETRTKNGVFLKVKMHDKVAARKLLGAA